MIHVRGTLAAVLAASFGVVLARAWQESEHDPWPLDCPTCGQTAPSLHGPVIVTWMNNHNCKGETS